jgi:hypothetical protein
LELRDNGAQTMLTVWMLNQAVPTAVIPSISIPFQSERGRGKSHQKGSHQKPCHYSPSKHGDPVGRLAGMNEIILRVHFNPPFVIPPSQKPG